MGPTIETTREVEVHLALFDAFERAAGRGTPFWLAEMRRAAIGRFAELGFPTTREEEWRFTNAAPIARARFRPAGPRTPALDAARIGELAVTLPGAVRLVLVDGRFEPRLSAGEAAGVLARGLRQALDEDPEEVRAHLGRLAPFQAHAFTALNTAFLEDGVYVKIAKGAFVEEPVHVVHVASSADEPTLRHPRVLAVAEEGSQVRLVESYVSLGEEPALTNAVTEIAVSANAVFDHYRLLREGPASWHVARLEAAVGASAAYRLHTFSFGAALARHEINALLDGEGADAILNGLYVVDGAQHVDHHTGIDHAKPHCTSHELFKGILDGRSTAVFNGRIRVRRGAQKTDSKQTNKNLLLSGEALVQTNPQLEIYADDVKCTHGATIGQIDEAALFYLRSRGIPLAAANGLLTYAFAADVVDGVRIEALRRALDGCVGARFREPAERR